MFLRPSPTARILHGKEGVDGSSPSEGSKIPGNRGFLLPALVQPSTSLGRRGSAVEQPAATRPEPLGQAPCVAGSRAWCDWRFGGDRFWGHSTRRSGAVRVLRPWPAAGLRVRAPADLAPRRLPRDVRGNGVGHQLDYLGRRRRAPLRRAAEASSLARCRRRLRARSGDARGSRDLDRARACRPHAGPGVSLGHRLARARVPT
jgi:hypothetical protein